MKTVSVQRAWEETSRLWQAHGRLFSTIALALVVFPSVFVRVVWPEQTLLRQSDDQALLSDLVLMFCGAVSLVGQIALMRLALVPNAQVGESLKIGARGTASAFGAMLILLTPLVALLFVAMKLGTTLPLAASVLSLLVIVITLFLAIRMAFFLPLAALGKTGPIAIARGSMAMTKGASGRILLAYLAATLVALVVAAATHFSLGALAVLSLGKAEPLTVSALVIALLTQLPLGFLTAVFATLLARLAAQRLG